MLTAIQKEACRLMDERNLGAIVTKFGWTWKETCRKNEEAAKEVVQLLSKSRRAARKPAYFERAGWERTATKGE